MWISRVEYKQLLERIEKLERLQNVHYARERDLCFLGLPLLPAQWHDADGLTGSVDERVTVNALVARIAQYLGFKIEPKVTTGGRLVDPPKLWVDIHDRTPKSPETIRIRTGNKTRIKRGKIDNE